MNQDLHDAGKILYRLASECTDWRAANTLMEAWYYLMYGRYSRISGCAGWESATTAYSDDRILGCVR